MKFHKDIMRWAIELELEKSPGKERHEKLKSAIRRLAPASAIWANMLFEGLLDLLDPPKPEPEPEPVEEPQDPLHGLIKFEFIVTVGEADLFWQMLAEAIGQTIEGRFRAIQDGESQAIVDAYRGYEIQEKAFRETIFKTATRVPGSSPENLLFVVPQPEDPKKPETSV